MTRGNGYQAEDAFLDTLADAARRDGRRSRLRLLSELDRLSSSRNRWRPQSVPSAAYLGACLKHGPEITADLRGSIAGMQSLLHWERVPPSPGIGAFRDRSAYTTIVGPEARVPSTRLMVGLFIVDPDIHYPPHAHAAEELYLPLSGTALYAKGDAAPSEEAPGTFLYHRAWQTHAMWTSGEPVLNVWIWMGDVDGGYKLANSP